jgi:hypothetical protein
MTIQNIRITRFILREYPYDRVVIRIHTSYCIRIFVKSVHLFSFFKKVLTFFFLYSLMSLFKIFTYYPLYYSRFEVDITGNPFPTFASKRDGNDWVASRYFVAKGMKTKNQGGEQLQITCVGCAFFVSTRKSQIDSMFYIRKHQACDCFQKFSRSCMQHLLLIALCNHAHPARKQRRGVISPI